MKNANDYRLPTSIKARPNGAATLRRPVSSACEPLESRTLFSTYTVTSQSDDGPGSLREAIQLSNNDTSAKDMIDFNIDLGFQDDDGAIDIYLQSPLPVVADPVTIDATSEKTYLFGANAGATADGLYITAGNSEVIGLGFAGFGGAAVHLAAGPMNDIENNHFGLITGPNTVLGNHEGIRLDNSSQNTIKNNNVIASAADGIVANDSGFNNIGLNTIGIRYDDVAAPNGGSGIHISGAADSNSIYANLISSNAGSGIWLEGAVYITVGGNIIGLDSTKLLDRGNGLDGIRIDQNGQSNSIGDGSDNDIAFNHGAGVNILSGVANPIRGNHIHSNVGLGIDLGGDGVTPNDAGDGDTGANDLQNHPIVTKVVSDGAKSGVVHVVFDGLMSTVYSLELYQVNQPDALSGEGDFSIYSNTITTDAAGHYSADLGTAPVATNAFVSGTVTDPNGNTSEFSAAQKNDGIVPPKQNQNPIANLDSVTTSRGQPIVIQVLKNDTDPDGDPIFLSGESGGMHGMTSQSGPTITYTPIGTFTGVDTFSYFVADGKGGMATGTVKVTVKPNTVPEVALVTDPANPGAFMLQIIGTEKADTIALKKGNVPNSSVVTANGKDLGAFATDRAIIYSLSGDDKITIDAAITSAQWIDAGEGKDNVTGGSGDDLILGGGGEDKLYGKAGRDILLGGHQGDLLDGGAGEDLMVAGTLAGDGDIRNLISLSKEWSRTDLPFAQRLDHIRNGGATSFNGTTRINNSTASSGASPVDTLTGGSESDGFFYNFDQKPKNHDKVTDLTAADKGIDIG